MINIELCLLPIYLVSYIFQQSVRMFGFFLFILCRFSWWCGCNIFPVHDSHLSDWGSSFSCTGCMRSYRSCAYNGNGIFPKPTMSCVADAPTVLH